LAVIGIGTGLAYRGKWFHTHIPLVPELQEYKRVSRATVAAELLEPSPTQAEEEFRMRSLAIKRFLIGSVVGAAFLVLGGAAHADDIATYDLENVSFAGGGTATGSFTYDFTTNTYTAIDLSTQDVPGVADQSFALSGPNGLVPNDFDTPTGFCAGCSPGPVSFDQFALNNGTDVLFLVLSLPAMTPGTNPLVPDLFDSSGDPLNDYSDLDYDCTNSNSGDGPGCYSVVAVESGAVSTPEPSAGLLLLVGCFALLIGYGVRRKGLVHSPSEA
jgi:hypothetical protein